MPAAVESMMYAKEVPWHGLGTYVGDHPVLAEEAMVAAQLDWTVEKFPAMAAVTRGTEEIDVEVPGHYFTVRDRDNKVLGHVQESYTILQNSEAFEFMDRLAGPHNLVRYHTAGSLHGGRVIWLLAEVVGLTFEAVPGDPTVPYLLLSNGHGGKVSLQAMQTSVRVVCQNTLTLAMKNAKGKVKIRHTGRMSEKMKAAQDVLNYSRDEFTAYKEAAEHLAAKKMGDKVLEQFLDHLFPLKKDSDNTRQKNVRERVIELYESGPGADLPGVRGSAWGALQAITNYTTHHRPTRGAGDDEQAKREKRLEATWFGTGNTLNQKALNYLLETA